MESLVHAVQEVYRNRQNIDISLNIIPRPHGKPYLVLGHELRLGQVISNLIENARSFIPHDNGKICITMKSNAANLVLIIEDNGPGIRSENIERILNVFILIDQAKIHLDKTQDSVFLLVDKSLRLIMGQLQRKILLTPNLKIVKLAHVLLLSFPSLDKPFTQSKRHENKK